MTDFYLILRMIVVLREQDTLTLMQPELAQAAVDTESLIKKVGNIRFYRLMKVVFKYLCVKGSHSRKSLVHDG